MSKSFLSEEATDALTGAIRSIESRSGAEVVISVKAHSGRYSHVGPVTGAVAAFFTLAFLLYAPWGFSYWSILLDPLIVGIVAGLAGWRTPALRRLLTPASAMGSETLKAAQATFFARLSRRICG